MHCCSYTFQKVQEQSEQLWRFNRYSLVNEFFNRPKICPPLIIISHLFRVWTFIGRPLFICLANISSFRSLDCVFHCWRRCTCYNTRSTCNEFSMLVLYCFKNITTQRHSSNKNSKRKL